MRQQTKEDALETLKKFDTVLIVDDSGSMKNSDLWVEVCSLLMLDFRSADQCIRLEELFRRWQTQLDSTMQTELIYIF